LLALTQISAFGWHVVRPAKILAPGSREHRDPWNLKAGAQKQRLQRVKFIVFAGEPLNDIVDTEARPRFSGLGGGDEVDEETMSDGFRQRAVSERRKKRSSVNSRLLSEISDIEQSLPMRESDRAPDVVAPFGGYKEDLEQVNPFFALFGAAFTLGGSYGMWQLTNWLAEQFTAHPLGDDTFYVVQRIALVVRTCVVASAALGTGLFGLTGFGLGLMSLRVVAGLLTGELKSPGKN